MVSSVLADARAWSGACSLSCMKQARTGSGTGPLGATRGLAILASLAVALGTVACIGPPAKPTVPAADQQVPRVPPGRALVVFVWPACERYIPASCVDLFSLSTEACRAVFSSTAEERFMCMRTHENR